jgi:hypothetical protein
MELLWRFIKLNEEFLWNFSVRRIIKRQGKEQLKILNDADRLTPKYKVLKAATPSQLK